MKSCNSTLVVVFPGQRAHAPWCLDIMSSWSGTSRVTNSYIIDEARIAWENTETFETSCRASDRNLTLLALSKVYEHDTYQ